MWRESSPKTVQHEVVCRPRRCIERLASGIHFAVAGLGSPEAHKQEQIIVTGGAVGRGRLNGVLQRVKGRLRLHATLYSDKRNACKTNQANHSRQSREPVNCETAIISQTNKGRNSHAYRCDACDQESQSNRGVHGARRWILKISTGWRNARVVSSLTNQRRAFYWFGYAIRIYVQSGLAQARDCLASDAVIS
jgi:hypothetical protein